MVNAQEYLNQKYPTKEEREKVTDLNINFKELEGKLDLTNFINLKRLWCSGQKLTELNLINCPQLAELDCSDNLITELNLSNCSQLTEICCHNNRLRNLKVVSLPHLKKLYAWTNNLANLNWEVFTNPQKLTHLSLSNNNFVSQDLSYFNQFTNLEELFLGNDIEEKIKKGEYNHFCGSLELLVSNLTKLKKLQIEGTEVDELKGGLVNEALKSLNKKIEKFLEIYDEACDGKKDKEIDINELTTKRSELINDLNKERDSEVQGVVDAIKELEEAIIEYRESVYYEEKVNEEKIQQNQTLTNLESHEESVQKPKVFLGGTCNDSIWREELISQLNISYFNPVVKVEDWTPEYQQEEFHQKEICDFVLYTITKEITGTYSIAEVIDDSNKRPQKTIFCYLEEGFSESQIKSLKAVARLVEKNGAKVFTSLEEVTEYLNKGQLEFRIEVPSK